MKKTKIVAVAAATLMAATAVGALAGCGGDPAYTISVFLLANNHESKFYDSYFEHLEEEFAAEGLNYEIKASYEQEANYYDKLDTMITRDEAPDIFYVRPNELLQYQASIVSLQSYLDGEGKDIIEVDKVNQMALDMYRFNPTTGVLGNPSDEIYAFPKDLSTQQLGYNKTLLSKFEKEIKDAGLELPWEKDFTKGTYTWEQYKQMCTVIANSSNKGQTEYACDVPSIEVLSHSFKDAQNDGSLIDLSGGRANGKVTSIAEGTPLQKAIKYQAELVDCGAANYKGATYANFTAGRVCFYGLIGSWEVADYNDHLGAGNWGVMPWPTVSGGTDWEGVITSAGYVVSKSCVNNAENPAKGDIAKRIAISFMSSYAQNLLVKEEQISLPLLTDMASSYRDPANDTIYSPSTRGYFLDVVSGSHGFTPAEYSTYDSVWLNELDSALELVWNEGKGAALAKYNSTDWNTVQTRMQEQYDRTKSN